MKSGKSGVIALTLLLSTMGLAIPAMAQIHNPSQDFFERGREQLEREIQVLQGEAPDLEESLQQPESEQLLDVRPSPEHSPNSQPDDVEAPNPKPDEVNNSGS
jgi:hypothetical protein